MHTLEEALEAIDAGVLFLDVLRASLFRARRVCVYHAGDGAENSAEPDKDTKVHDAGVIAIAERLAQGTTKIKSINLYDQVCGRHTRVHVNRAFDQGITAAGVSALADVLHATHIQKLRLGGNGFGDAGCLALAKVLPTTKMTNLDLYDNGITDEGLKAVLFASPTTLNGLTTEKNPLSGEGMALIKDWNFSAFFIVVLRVRCCDVRALTFKSALERRSARVAFAASSRVGDRAAGRRCVDVIR